MPNKYQLNMLWNCAKKDGAEEGNRLSRGNGAGGGNRTLTVVRLLVFETSAYTSSATPA